MPGFVLAIEDNENVHGLLARALRDGGHRLQVCTSAEEGLVALEASLPDVVLLDLSLPGMSGLDALARISALRPTLPVVMFTADDSVDTVVQAMQLGAYDYLAKPFAPAKLVTTIERAIERNRLAFRITQLEHEVARGRLSGIIGDAPVIHEMLTEIHRVAETDIAVYIHGETGTGKELVAHAIHQASARANGPFVVLNCAAIAEHLQESELFGHEKGAFTGAQSQHKGRFEQADGGTIFLDEVGELSLAAQAKLLRALQERSFHRVGGRHEVRSDFRLIVATHRDLSEETRAGRFREDVYFRVAVFEIIVPPLRARAGDVPLLVQHMLKSLSQERGIGTVAIDQEALDLLSKYDWPGNVRELQNTLQRACVVCRDAVIHVQDLPARVKMSATPAPIARSAMLPPASSGGDDFAEAHSVDDAERRAIEAALSRTQGNLSEATRQLGIGRTTLYRKLRKYGIAAR